MLWSPDAFADWRLAALDKQMNLSAEQKPKVRAVFVEVDQCAIPDLFGISCVITRIY